MLSQFYLPNHTQNDILAVLNYIKNLVWTDGIRNSEVVAFQSEFCAVNI